MTRSADFDGPHPSWRIAIHWTTAALIVIGVGAVLGREWVDDRLLRDGLLRLHRASGLMVMVLTVLRMLSMPWLDSGARGATALLRWSAHLSHFLLYGLLVGLPLVGWALSSAHGQTVYFLGVLPLPALVSRDRDLADQLQDVHEEMAIALLLVVALHSAAAIWHHYALGDAVLHRMLPGRMRKRVPRRGSVRSTT